MVSHVTVLIVDRDPDACHEMRAKLPAEAGIDVVAEACTIREAIQCLDEHAPRVVLLADQRDGLRGIAFLAALRRKQPETRCIIISEVVDVETRVNCVEAGADAVLLRGSTPAEFLETLAIVAAGTNLLKSQALSDSEMMQRLLDQVRNAPAGRRPMNRFDPGLSPCLLGVLDGVVQGWCNRRISQTEGIAEQTVKHHVANLKQRLGVRDRIGLVRHAVLHEWANLQEASGSTRVEQSDGGGRDELASLAVIVQVPRARRSVGLGRTDGVSRRRTGFSRLARRV